ncbi:MAG: phosphoribosylanthranilate isomerase [Clostridia bacterium]|nr:phosphoribosylanthranilate isomerase [Clostridia bacterium]
MDVKICGLRRIEDALMVNEFKNIKYAGLVFANTKRKVTVEQAAAIKNALREDIKTVGVFTETSAKEINEIARAVGLDICQLHSDESNEDCGLICTQVWKAIRVKNEDSIKEADSFTDADGFVLDKYKANEYGGTGEAFNWNIAKAFSKNHFTVLAGGLNKENILSAVEMVKPDVVDLSSSVETDGYKDYNKIKEFMERIDSNGVK